MPNINEKITKNFNENIEYIKINHPLLFDKLVSFESAVEGGHYVERYALVYENDMFDIYDKKLQKNLYGGELNSYIKILEDSVTLLKNENVFQSFKTIAKESAPKMYQFVYDLTQTLSQEQSMKHIYKFVFFGVGIGMHIPVIHKKIDAKSYFIIEDNLELFRISLFTTPYYEIAKQSTLSFSIFDSKESYTQKSINYIQQEFYYNHYIKFLQLPSHPEEKLEQFHLQLTTQSHLNFSYESILEQYTHPLTLMAQNFHVLNILTAKLPATPILYVAPGPSLSKNIQWLQKVKNSYLIVALSATLNTLKKANITPDIVTHFDGFERSAVHFNAIKESPFCADTLFLLSTKTPLSILNILNKEHVYLFEGNASYKEDFGNLSAFCAGSSTYLLLLALGSTEIYTLGLDLGVDKETLATHSQEYEYKQELSSTQEDTLSFRDSLLSIEGNFEEQTLSTPNFMISINAIQEISKNFKKPTQVVYNLSDGAKLEGFISLHPQEIHMQTPLNKKELSSNIFKIFKEHSASKLSKKEIQNLDAFIHKAHNFLLIVHEQEKKEFLHQETFLNSLVVLQDALTSQQENDTLDLILAHYFKYIYTYIFDFYNTQDNFTNNYNIVNTQLCTNITTIITSYADRIQQAHG